MRCVRTRVGLSITAGSPSLTRHPNDPAILVEVAVTKSEGVGDAESLPGAVE